MSDNGKWIKTNADAFHEKWLAQKPGLSPQFLESFRRKWPPHLKMPHHGSLMNGPQDGDGSYQIDENVLVVTDEIHVTDELIISEPKLLSAPQSAAGNNRTRYTIRTKHGIRIEVTEGDLQVVPPAPPPTAEVLFTAFLPKRRAEAILGDLDERFADDCARFGTDRARRRYWGYVLNSLLPLALHGLKKLRSIALLEAARKIFLG